MTPMVVVYHSGFGHTEQVARCVAAGANRVANVQAQVMAVADVDWDILKRAEAIIFGAPVYMGSVSAPFKQFMDDSSRIWFSQGWQDKVAAGFVNSGALSGDKQVALQQLQTFAGQHGMVWMNFALQPTGIGPDDLNRLGSYSGLMTQADNEAPEHTPPAGDRATAEAFGEHIARRTQRWQRGGNISA